jgi:hypothetical protein
MENPKLLEATTEEPRAAVARIAVGWGLTIGEKAYLIPFSTRERWEGPVRDYKGDAELVINAGGAKFIDAFNFYSRAKYSSTSRARIRS